MPKWQVWQGDCIDTMALLIADGSVQTCITSPPYFGLRDYGVAGQVGQEKTPDEYVAKLVTVFREVRRVLRADGTLWLNLGDSYVGVGGQSPQGGGMFAERRRGKENIMLSGRHPPGDGLKVKDLLGIPWLVAFALRADGWYLRQDIIWHKPNPMPESVRDRCTKSHEYIFLFSKSEKYYFDNKAIEEPAVEPRGPGNKKPGFVANEREGENANLRGGIHKIGPRETRNKRSVWSVSTKPYKGAHFATFPPELIAPCVLAGSPPGGLVLDPFAGTGTTAGVAVKHGRDALLCELNADSIAQMPDRIARIQAAA